MPASALPLLLALLAAAPSARVDPPRARPGDLVLVTAEGLAERPSGELLGRTLSFFPSGPGAWSALAGLPVEAPEGPAAIALIAGAARAEATLEVTAPDFRSTTLSVPPRFLEPPASARERIAQDRAALDRAYAQPFRPPLFTGRFAMPRQAELTGTFGDRRVYNGKTEGQHFGLDLKGAEGAPVAAANDGEVVLARDCYLSGQTVVVWHGAGLFSAYLHMSRMEVKPGDRVRRGDRIGRVGSTGRSTGPHLHWGMKLSGLWVDPESVLRLELPPAP